MSGKSQGELIREAIDLFGATHLQKNRLAIMRSVKGLWKNHTNLPDFSALRKEFDRKEE